MNEIENKDSLLCDICSREFKTLRAKNTHRHFCAKRVICKNCNNLHSETKHDPFKYCDAIKKNCEICERVFKTRNRENNTCVRCKANKTNIDKYGVTHNWQIAEVRAKANQSIQSDEVKESRRKTNLLRYGASVAMNSDDIREAFLDKRRKERGWSDDSIRFIKDKDFAESVINKIGDIVRVQDVENYLGCYSQQVGRAIRAHGLGYLIEKSQDNFESNYERSLKKYIRDLGFVTKKTTKVLDGKEIDCFVPDKSIGFEINGSYWHSDLFKKKDYHLDKTEIADKNGIRLIHIFDHEFLRNRDKIDSLISSALGISKTIYARKCKVVELTPSESRLFMDTNHLQGNVGASIRLGLEYEGEIVSVMTFGKPRFYKFDGVELLRFCSKLNYSVVGGASKLFSYAISNYSLKDVISYCNRAKFNGDVYEKLGFKHTRNTAPNYWWTEGSFLDVIPRYQTQMKNEDEIMRKKGYFRVYDCGNKVFEYHA